jgi:hypothetical protein
MKHLRNLFELPGRPCFNGGNTGTQSDRQIDDACAAIAHTLNNHVLAVWLVNALNLQLTCMAGNQFPAGSMGYFCGKRDGRICALSPNALQFLLDKLFLVTGDASPNLEQVDHEQGGTHAIDSPENQCPNHRDTSNSTLACSMQVAGQPGKASKGHDSNDFFSD